MERLKGTSIYDYLVILISVAIAAAMTIVFFRMRTSGAEYAGVAVNGEMQKELLLSKDYLLELDSMNIEVKNGRIRITSSECPRKICVESGWISSPGQSLICIPNRTVVFIRGHEKDKIYDAVTY